jgi:hypothetical protein
LWTTIFVAMFLGFWLAVDRLSGVCEAVTLERDLTSGLRLGGALMALGLLLGSAAAQTLPAGRSLVARRALAHAWPILALLLVFLLLQRVLRPTPRRVHASAIVLGIFPATAYIAGAILYLRVAGAGQFP